MRVAYLDAADYEIAEATAYYNEERAGLGFEFVDEIKYTIERIKNYPEAWTPLSKRTRRCQVHRFPYSVIYEVRSNFLIIVAIQHNRRKPEDWRARLK
jgi:plasmid stabilization system protein ParE